MTLKKNTRRGNNFYKISLYFFVLLININCYADDIISSSPLLNIDKIKPSYELAGDQVKVTYYFENGAIYKQGFFKNKKLSGNWLEFDQKGNRVASGFYKEGKYSN